MKKSILKEAAAAAGFREKYALENFTRCSKRRVKNEVFFTFYYSISDPYQDANGATYNATRHTWIG